MECTVAGYNGYVSGNFTNVTVGKCNCNVGKYKCNGGNGNVTGKMKCNRGKWNIVMGLLYSNGENVMYMVDIINVSQ
jgi:hypothetical protein